MPYLFNNYISPEGKKNLAKYKYKGSDDSLIFKYVTNPIYNRMLPHIPVWIAPNLITVLGLVCTLITHLFFWWFVPNLDIPAPKWLYGVTAVSFIMYQTLDALDGKQARRTGSSSPLGLLFDHGCDAVNTTTMAISMAAALQMGPTWKSALLWGSAALPFFLATWEEYYTGELHLPIVNGPTEGILIAAFTQVVTMLLPEAWWTGTIESLGMARNTAFVFTSVALAIPTCLHNVRNVVNAVLGIKKQPSSHSQTVHSAAQFRVAFSRTVPIVSILALAAAWVAWSPADVMRAHPRLVIWTLGLLLSKLVTGLMLAHLCDEEYHPFSKTIAVVLMLSAHALVSLLQHRGSHALDGYEDLVIWEFFLIALGSYAHLVVTVIGEVTRALHIRCFTIPVPPKAA